MVTLLPLIPAKRYFTIGEVAQLCDVKPHVLRYWEQEFTQLRPLKRRGNRRYYQHHEVLMIRRIRGLLYDEGFTIQGARSQLQKGVATLSGNASESAPVDATAVDVGPLSCKDAAPLLHDLGAVRQELLEIQLLLSRS